MSESSGASCPGLIEARLESEQLRALSGSSGASCPGLIEALILVVFLVVLLMSHPGLLAPASLKRAPVGTPRLEPGWVIRGFLPRPH